MKKWLKWLYNHNHNQPLGPKNNGYFELWLRFRFKNELRLRISPMHLEEESLGHFKSGSNLFFILEKRRIGAIENLILKNFWSFTKLSIWKSPQQPKVDQFLKIRH